MPTARYPAVLLKLVTKQPALYREWGLHGAGALQDQRTV
jgi:hypothetical protein